MPTTPEMDLIPESDDGQLRDLISLGRGTELPQNELVPVHELVRRAALEHPDRTAVTSGGHAVSYRELDRWARRIADELALSGVSRGGRVGVLADPSTAMVAAVLGVLHAGAAYVPVDLAHPNYRIANVFSDSLISAAVTTSSSQDRLDGHEVPIIRAEVAAAGGLANDVDRTAAAPSPSTAMSLNNPAYLIYTSGSTGEPKGVLVEHRQLAASTLARRMVYPGAPVFLLVSPLAFDSSVAGLWGTLTAGGQLVVATSDEVRDPERLVDLIELHGVTHMLCVPSLYSVILDVAENLGPRRLATLTTVIVAGEPLPVHLVERHFKLHSHQSALVNEYGPTEATVWSTYHRFDAPGPVSIGRPVPGTRLYVLDNQLRPVPRGVEGELYIGGVGVTRGYYGRPDATARAFLKDVFADREDARMYRTGDLVRWNSDGTLDFLGRRDHQVKVRGHRIELGAVEAVLASLPGVREAVVTVDTSGTGLIGFVLGSIGLSSDELKEKLADRLPTVMVPANLQILDTFPRTVNGKTDRPALRAAVDNPSAADPAHSVPSATASSAGDLTGQVAAAWAEVLKTADIPTDANFYELGGHSLMMYQLQAALERHTGERPPVVALYGHTTVAEQATFIRGLR
ncbi:non-ribosomal peptide synthetase [Streptomyces albidoflavus]